MSAFFNSDPPIFHHVFRVHVFGVPSYLQVAKSIIMIIFILQYFSLVAFVVKKNGLLTKLQNIVIGWGVGVGITLVVVSLEYKNYGGYSADKQAAL